MPEKAAKRSFRTLCERFGVKSVEAAGLRKYLQKKLNANGMIDSDEFRKGREAFLKSPAGR